MKPGIRALMGTYLFSVAALWTVLFHNAGNALVVPHLLFFATLTLNTYFSIRFYAEFTPSSVFQSVIDAVLTVMYIGLAFTIGEPVLFVLYALIVFTIAPAKYAHMLGRTPYDATLRRKMLIDLAGTCMCLGIFILTLAGFALEGAWLLAILFVTANVYLLVLNPMYRHEVN